MIDNPSPIYFRRPVVPNYLFAQLLLYKYGILIKLLPEHLIALIFANSLKNYGSLSEKEIERLQYMPEKFQSVLKALKTENFANLAQNLKGSENLFFDHKGEIKNRLLLEPLISEVKTEIMKEKQEKRTENSAQEANLYKNPSEAKDKAFIKERIFEVKDFIVNDKKDSSYLKKENDLFLKATEIIRDSPDKNQALANKEKSSIFEFSKMEKNSVSSKITVGIEKQVARNITKEGGVRSQDIPKRERENQVGFLKNREEKVDERTLTKPEVKDLQYLEAHKYFEKDRQNVGSTKIEIGTLHQEKLSESDKALNTGKFMQGHEAQSTGEINPSNVTNSAFFALPYFLQEKVNFLLSKNEKFKFKKVVKKEKNPSHDKRDEEKDYPTVDDIS